VRLRARDLPVMTMTLEFRAKNSCMCHHDLVIIAWLPRQNDTVAWARNDSPHSISVFEVFDLRWL